MANKIDTNYFRLRARQLSYMRRETAMLDWIRERIDDGCYVSWSAGKDSMVVAHAVNQVHPVPVLMVDPGVPIHWTDEDKKRMVEYAEQQRWKWQLFPWSKSLSKAPESDAAYRRQIHSEMFIGLTTYAKGRRLERRITGMRASESKTRHIFLAASRGETKNTLQPLWSWATEDVWTYIVRHNLPWLSVYDYLGPDARNGLIGKNGREHGRMVYLKKFYPQAFQRACELFDARTHV